MPLKSFFFVAYLLIEMFDLAEQVVVDASLRLGIAGYLDSLVRKYLLCRPSAWHRVQELELLLDKPFRSLTSTPSLPPDSDPEVDLVHSRVMADAEEANEEAIIHPCWFCRSSTRAGGSTERYIKYDFLTNCFCCHRALCTWCRRSSTTIGLHRGPVPATVCPICEPDPWVECLECNATIWLQHSSMCDTCDELFCQKHIRFVARGTGYSPCCYGADCSSTPTPSSSTPSTPSTQGDDGPASSPGDDGPVWL